VNYKIKQAEERTGESAAHVVLVSQNHGIDSFWKQLGPESNGEYTHPQLRPNRRLQLQCQLCSYKPEDSASVIYLARFEFFLSIGINLTLHSTRQRLHQKPKHGGLELLAKNF
jgi:hypothetical protein